VVIAEERPIGKLFGIKLGRGTKIRLEHADPGPHDEVFDAVDDGCRRPRVR
jgi:hypothetical protein